MGLRSLWLLSFARALLLLGLPIPFGLLIFPGDWVLYSTNHSIYDQELHVDKLCFFVYVALYIVSIRIM